MNAPVLNEHRGNFFTNTYSACLIYPAHLLDTWEHILHMLYKLNYYVYLLNIKCPGRQRGLFRTINFQITYFVNEWINTQYMRNPDIIYVLKMEYVSKINIFGLKMMVKSGLEKIFLKTLHAQSLFRKFFFAS